MWNMVHLLQIVIFLPELLQWPPHGQLLTDSLKEAVELEDFMTNVKKTILPEELHEYVIEEKIDEEDDEDKLVPDSLFIGLGIFAILLVFLIMLIIIYCVIKAFQTRVKKCCNPLYVTLRKKLFFGVFIRYLMEGNLDIAYQSIAFVAIAEKSSQDAEEKGSNVFSRIGFITMLAAFLIFAIVLPQVKQSKL